MRRKKMMLTCVVFLLAIGAITSIIIYKINEPKNVFEEIYYVEMDAAKSKRYTPLSNTEYFNASASTITDYKKGAFTTETVEEVAKDNAPYTLLVQDVIYMNTTTLFWLPGVKEYDLMQKIVKLEHRFLDHGIDIKIEYRYLLFSDGTVRAPLYDDSKEGLSIQVTGSIEGNNLTTFQEFNVYGIEENRLKDKIDQGLKYFLNYWVDNYAKSKFNHDDFGLYEIVKINR